MMNRMNIVVFTITIDGPGAISSTNENNIPKITLVSEINAEIIIVCLNPRDTCKLDTVGKMIKLEINSVPIILIPTVIVTAVKIERT